MRAIWKGAVSFGLVSIGVKVYSATEEKDIRFHQVHREDGGRIRYKRTCSVCGEEVTYDDIAKGYDIGGGEMVILTDEDFADLPLSTSHAIDVLEFVPAEQVDPILYNKAYFLEPEGSATKPYVLLRDALSDSERVAIVKVALRQREQLATLRVREGVLLLNTMLWPDEIRRPDFGFLDEDLKVRPPELAMASSLIDSMAGEFEPDAFTDDYRAALQEVIDAKVEGREVVQPEEEEAAPAAAVDLMAALKASVERARAARGEAPSGGGAEPTPISSARSAKKAAKKAPARKPAEKKAEPAKKTAAKKTPAKKTAEKKTEPAKKTAAKKTTAKKAAAKKSA
ncbi:MULTISPECIES: non-homologous end joining protein Ku [Micromonospora]|uniref:Non-homologous end joining protein Ku n=1 Tax=Micromonospora chalcea TaxID=1874 RepID=A0ABX9Y4R8_MICCH|nr:MULTISPECIES: Ku protein [Micromonospora]EWM66343.1 Ku protein [Micromonospora sp. M42]MBC8991284.1 Ku protein [Micromonospora chalcea]MBQ1068790.1 Ku protein [Micromonospora sp. D75]MCK1809231.1 Ku protein [Micromonospora sp. R42106]MCK1834870.1 Ku protein [Micromonospora sp. R42003]